MWVGNSAPLTQKAFHTSNPALWWAAASLLDLLDLWSNFSGLLADPNLEQLTEQL